MTRKTHVTPHFDCPDQTSVIVPLLMPLALHDIDAGASILVKQ